MRLTSVSAVLCLALINGCSSSPPAATDSDGDDALRHDSGAGRDGSGGQGDARLPGDDSTGPQTDGSHGNDDGGPAGDGTAGDGTASADSSSATPDGAPRADTGADAGQGSADGAVAAGDGAVTTGDGPVTTGDGPVTTGDGPVATGDGAVTTADAAVATADGGGPTTFDQVQLNGSWRAYNDCVGGTGNAANVTAFTYEGTASGLLRRYADGSDTAVTLTVAGQNLTTWAPPGLVFDNGTDARAVFQGIVNLAEVASYANEALDGSYSATFTGLDPSHRYALVTTANRQEASYGIDGSSPRWTRFEVLGAASLENISSRGVTRESISSVVINTGYNTERGQVAAWTNIATSSGTITLISRNVGPAGPGHATKFYGMQGLMLVELLPASSGG